MKTYSQLIKNMVGQLNGIDRMMQDDKDCFATLTQMKAVKSALVSLMNRYMSENFQACLRQCKRKGEEETVCKRFLDEINH